jgi:hypothetical protein
MDYHHPFSEQQTETWEALQHVSGNKVALSYAAQKVQASAKCQLATVIQ